jgi:hypothetical protein
MQQPQAATVVFVGGQATVGAPAAYVLGVPQPTVITTYKRKQSIAIGIILMVSALLSFAFNSAELGVGLNGYYWGFIWGVIGHGYWTGTMVNDAEFFFHRLYGSKKHLHFDLNFNAPS